jgi:peptidoglycan hydrolase FlgJ
MDNSNSLLSPVLPDQSVIQSAVTGGAKKAHGKSLDAVAEDFEAMFASQMMAPMWAGIDADPMFGGGMGEETFRSLMINEYGKIIAKSGGIGVAPYVKTELLRAQEAANA